MHAALADSVPSPLAQPASGAVSAKGKVKPGSATDSPDAGGAASDSPDACPDAGAGVATGMAVDEPGTAPAAQGDDHAAQEAAVQQTGGAGAALSGSGKQGADANARKPLGRRARRHFLLYCAYRVQVSMLSCSHQGGFDLFVRGVRWLSSLTSELLFT